MCSSVQWGNDGFHFTPTLAMGLGGIRVPASKVLSVMPGTYTWATQGGELGVVARLRVSTV